MRLVLDQNFPLPLVQALRDYMPPSIQLTHIASVDVGLSTLSDADLIREIQQRGYDGVITTDYHMLDDVETVTTMVETKSIVVAIKAAGHDPLKASGALFLELPGLADRLRAGDSNIILIKPKQTHPRPAWEYLKEIAERQGTTAHDLWERAKAERAPEGQ